jgi:radical SAM modification target selenobiotic family peptide
MGAEKLKGLLAGIGLAGLLTGAVVTAPANVHGSSG